MSSIPTTRKLSGVVVTALLAAAFAFQSAAPAEGMMATGPSSGPGCPGPVKRDGRCMTFAEYSKKCRKKGGTPVREHNNGRVTWRCEILIFHTSAPQPQPQSAGPHQAVSR